MADTPELVSMAQAFTGLPMEDLIGAPLIAAANANAAMAMTQTQFMLNTCFQYNATDKTYNPIMIKMTLTRGVLVPSDTPGEAPSVVEIVTNFDLPILTIIPLNSLAVDDVNVAFTMEVKSAYGEETNKAQETTIAASTEWSVKVGWGPVSASISGNASYNSRDTSSFNSHYDKSNSAQYTVQVHAGQLPLPKGVETIINAFTLAIQPIELPQNAPTTPAAAGGGANVSVNVQKNA